MGYMNEFPHSRMFDSDLREILEMFNSLKKLPDEWTKFQNYILEKFGSLENFIKEYFNNLDIQDEINNKINELLAEDKLYVGYVMPQLYGAKGDGVNDDTDAIKKCFAENNYIHIPTGTYLVKSTIDITGKTISGSGYETVFKMDGDVTIFTSSGNTTLHDLMLSGNWDGVTGGKNGNGISIMDVNETPYNIDLYNLKIRNINANGINIEHGGYTNLTNIDCRVCGLNGIEITGDDTNIATTISINGSVFSDNPNGYGIVLTNVNSVSIMNTIIEYSNSILVSGNTNRNIALINVYEENIRNSKFLVLDGAGVGITITSCYGSNTSIDYNNNYYGLIGISNTSITFPQDCYNWRMVDNENTLSLINPYFILGARANMYWDIGHLILDTYNNNKLHMWINSNKSLLIKRDSDPISENDGNTIVECAPSPTNTNSFGIPGQIAVTADALYIFTNEGWKKAELSSF